MQLTKQIGEHLVVVELGKRGLFATPFSGNVPEFDLVTVRDDGCAVVIQVKTIRTRSWQLNADRFLDIARKADRQVVKGKRPAQYPELVWVLVRVHDDGPAEFFVLRQEDIGELIYQHYSDYLRKHGGRRPRNPKSTHTAIWLREVEKFRDNWGLITS